MADVTPETMTNDDLVKEAAILYSLSDALQEGMTDDDVAWVRGIDAEVKRRGLWPEARKATHAIWYGTHHNS